MKISELLDNVLAGMSTAQATNGMSFDNALSRVVDIFFARLQQMDSDLIREQWGSDDVLVDTETIYLPDDFRGFSPPVWIEDSSGNRTELSPLPYGTEESEGSIPEFYRLVGPKRVQFIPKPEDAGTYDETYYLAGWYYSRPSDLELTADMPWEGLFDTEFEDAVIMVLSAPRTELVNPQFKEFVGALIDKQIHNREAHPVRCKTWV